MRSCEIEWCGDRLALLAERAVWWAARETLIVADLHLGKPEHFRLFGAPVPEEVTRSDLARVSGLIEEFGPRRVVILGDLLHSRVAQGATVGALRRWRQSHAGVAVELVRGNHDRKAGDPPGEVGIVCLDGPVRDGALWLAHEPPDEPPGPTLAAHVHPAVRMSGRGARGSMRAPCFWVRKSLLVLPAFGAFTGCRTVRPRSGDRVFALGEGEIAEVGFSMRAGAR